MEIYFVRHGQTDGNISRRHQIDRTELTHLGQEQAIAVAKKLRALQPTHLVSSSLVRSIETARVIGNECDLLPEVSQHFVEIGRPQNLIGVHHFSWKSLWFYVRWYFGTGVSEETGGESYKAFRQRFESAKQFLAQYPADARVVVVSHGVFINFFMMHMCNNKWAHPLRIVSLARAVLRMPNTKVTKVIFDPAASAKQCAWSVDR